MHYNLYIILDIISIPLIFWQKGESNENWKSSQGLES